MASLTGNWKSFVIATDNHGQYCDKDAIRAFHRFCQEFAPKERIHAGDCWDLAPLRKGANEDEKRDSMIEDWHKGCEFLNNFKPTKMTLGNHDARIFDLAEKQSGVGSDLAIKWTQELGDTLEALGTTWVRFGKRSHVRIGETNVCVAHGVTHGKNAAERMAAAFASQGPVFIGHGHQLQFAQLQTIERRYGVMCGCLCLRDRDYNRAHLNTLGQENGWVYGAYNNRLNEVIWHQCRRIGNEFPVLGL